MKPRQKPVISSQIIEKEKLSKTKLLDNNCSTTSKHHQKKEKRKIYIYIISPRVPTEQSLSKAPKLPPSPDDKEVPNPPMLSPIRMHNRKGKEIFWELQPHPGIINTDLKLSVESLDFHAIMRCP